MHKSFSECFRALTGCEPLSWQSRLYQRFVGNDVPEVCSLQTGLGKTMVMAIWLIARAQDPRIPTRLIYVVDRRTVVDQATDLAERLVQNWPSVFQSPPPMISTLRGQLADNREWSRSPSHPAIIIGTVDLIGSALLFSGYRSTYKRRPLEAGLLGHDSLLVLDEAHLSRPFEKLLCAIATFQSTRGQHALSSKSLKIMRMSATGRGSQPARPFALETDAGGKLVGEDAQDPIIEGRLSAPKRLTIHSIPAKESIANGLARAALELSSSQPVGQRIVVFTRKPDDARAIAAAIRKHQPYEAVEILTGTMRGYERDLLVRKPAFQDRWLNGNLKPDALENQAPVFLISTSAGEVGFDLNADHLVGDPAPLDSWVQRLGRVNRRGQGNAQVHYLTPSEPSDKSPFDQACIATSNLFKDGLDVSPRALTAFVAALSPEQLEQASAPEVAAPELTDILLDSWSLTSITGFMPGRPEVGPWLRGIEDQLAQVTVAWRAELTLFDEGEFAEGSLSAIFLKHPIRAHESLTVTIGPLLEFLKALPKLKDRVPKLMETKVAVRKSWGLVQIRKLEDLLDSPGLFADATLIFPATFGGLKDGMLDAEAVRKVFDEAVSLDIADQPGYESSPTAPTRQRVLIQRTDEGWTAQSLPNQAEHLERKFPGETHPTSKELFDHLRSGGLRVRLVQPAEFDEEGNAIKSLVLLSPVTNISQAQDSQSLQAHVGAVEAEAKKIADALGLAGSDPVRVALAFAARWHDQGKTENVWQYFACAEPGDEPLGKVSKTRGARALRGYRHELGSLLLIQPERSATIGCMTPADPTALELALHLIATHHGGARPHFQPGRYDSFSPVEVESVRAEVMRRFARLQRQYGWWTLAWLENLLRCADALASADQDSEDDFAEVSAGQ